MTDKPRKIMIVGGGIGGRAMGILLEERLKSQGVEIEFIHADDIPKRRCVQSMIIFDELEGNMPDNKELIAKLKRREQELHAQKDQRDVFASQRYQKPPRIHGAAQHKRMAHKSKNRGKRK